eukprot:54584_2
MSCARTKFAFSCCFTFLKKNLNKRKIIVFFSSCNAVKYYSELLNYIDIPCVDLHGKQKQHKRTTTFFEFCNSKHAIMLCTDVAARGLDIPAVDWIIQFDPPDDPREYIHRVGRTARGEKGSRQGAAVFASNRARVPALPKRCQRAAEVRVSEESRQCAIAARKADPEELLLEQIRKGWLPVISPFVCVPLSAYLQRARTWTFSLLQNLLDLLFRRR